MAHTSEPKTNAVRIVEKNRIPFTVQSYEHDDGHIDGVSVAAKLGQDPATVYKTLVTRGASKTIYVFVIPVAKELHLKKAAKQVGEKSIEMIHVSEINKLTRYIPVVSSPIGMKKRFKTVVDASAQAHAAILVSAGKIGRQVELSPDALVGLIGGSFASVVKGDE